MTKRRVAAFFDRRIARQLIVAPMVVIITVVGVVCAPFILVASAVLDLATARTTFRRTRLCVLLLGAFVIETVFLFGSFLLWIATGFNLAGPARWRWHRYRRFLGMYTALLMKLIAGVLGTSVTWRDNADLSTGPVVVVARHTSFFDALIPATVLSHRNQLLAHHVVTHGLRYLPNLDSSGHRFPNRFVKRTPGEGSRELINIEKLGRVLDERSGAVIFPEGTFRTQERATRAVRRIRRRDPDLAARAEKLEHVLPPVANGTFALLAGAPDADVVICANSGLESFGSLRAIRERPIADHPIVVETWRIKRCDVPTELAEFNLWLFDQFVAIDDWVRSLQD